MADSGECAKINSPSGQGPQLWVKMKIRPHDGIDNGPSVGLSIATLIIIVCLGCAALGGLMKNSPNNTVMEVTNTHMKVTDNEGGNPEKMDSSTMNVL